MADDPIDTTAAAAELRRLRERVEMLERRLAELERSVGVTKLQNQPDVTIALPPLPPPARRAVPPPLPPRARRAGPAAERPAATGRAPRSLESVIGGNWASWIGAVVLFLGIVFFLKFAWDQGWIRPSPEARVAAVVTAGLALAAAGEWSFRRRLAGLAASLYGVGVAVILAAFFAANIYFSPPVMGRTATFACVAVTAAAALLVALRLNAMAVAILALVGAYLAPRLLSSGRDESLFLLTYLGTLAAAGLGLAYARPRWIPLRWLTLIGTWLWTFGWWFTVGERNDHHTLALVFTCFLYAGFTIESVLSLRRKRDEPGTPWTPGQWVPPDHPALHVSLAIMSLIVTAATFGMLAAIYGPSSPPLLGAFAVGLAGAQVFASVYAPSRAWRVSSALQAAALVTLAVPMFLDEFAVTLAWVLLAVVLALLAWHFRIAALRAWAAALLLLAAGRLLAVDFSNPALRAVVLRLADQPVSRWLLMAWSIAALFHLLAWLRPRPRDEESLTPSRRVDDAPARSPILAYAASLPRSARRIVPRWLDPGGAALAILGTCLFAGVTAMRWSGPMYTLALIAWLAPIALLARLGRPVGYGWHAALLALLVSARWLVIDNLRPLIDAWTFGHTAPPILNLPAVCGLLLAGAVLLVCWDERLLGLHRDANDPNELVPDIRILAIAWAALIAFALVNFEIWRAVDWLDATRRANLADRGIVKQVSMSVMWALLGFAAVVIGFRKQLAPIRWGALALLGITLVKILVIDMAEVKAIWRILSFIAVGGLLLAVSFVYHRQMQGREGNETGADIS